MTDAHRRVETYGEGGQVGFGFEELAWRLGDFAIVGAAARVTINAKKKFEYAALGITGLGAKAYRASGVEKALRGKEASPKTIADAARHAAQGVEPLSDIHASAEYRREMAIVYARRALETAVARATGSKA